MVTTDPQYEMVTTDPQYEMVTTDPQYEPGIDVISDLPIPFP